MRIPSQPLLWGALLTLSAGAQAAVTKVIDNGPDAGKKVIAVLGDGYASSQQTRFNADVDNFVTKGVFGHDFYQENMSAFNVYRVNLVSVDTTVSTKTYDEKGTPTDPSDDVVTSLVMRNTPLKYVYSGSWAHCWVEESATTASLVQNALAANVPNADYVVVILNNPNFGGCGGGGKLVVPRGVDWTTVAHEMGHGIGGLMDEYQGGGAYTGGAVQGVNCTTDLNRATTYWNRFIDPATSLPTTLGAGMDANRSVGVFEGCATKDTKIYRPVYDCRMNSNSPNYCPVCYTHIKKLLYPSLNQTFDNAIYADFSGDGKDDVIMKYSKDLHLFQATGTAPYALNEVGVINRTVPAGTGGTAWTLGPSDQFYPGDFDGDGKVDLYVVNYFDHAKPMLGMLKSTGAGFQCIKVYTGAMGPWTLDLFDYVAVGDFNGDKKADLMLWNYEASPKKVAIFKSTGTAMTNTMNQSGSWTGWTMGYGDRFYLGDFDGDGKTDVFAQNVYAWNGTYYLGMLRSNGTTLTVTKKFTNTLPDWSLAPNDEIFVGDFDGDKKADIYIHNDGSDWSGIVWTAMMRSTGTDLQQKAIYSTNNNIPGWFTSSGDRYFTADLNKDGKTDLLVYNTANWGSQFLGALISNGSSLTCPYQTSGFVNGGWSLESSDYINPVRYEGAKGQSGIYIHKPEWFGLIRYANSAFAVDRYYYRWIYTPLYDSEPWNDDFP